MLFEMIFGGVILAYIIQTLIFYLGTKKKFPVLEEKDLPTATVIVAARNEEDAIIRCLKGLEKLEYPENKLQIILVDDKSTDKTYELIQNFIEGKPRFLLIRSGKEHGDLKGKTNALANGLDMATGEIILTTDADCVPHPKWVKTIGSYYTEGVGVVNGFTAQVCDSNFTGMQHLDFMMLLSVAAGTINFQWPLSCIGNNMSYLRKAYDEVGGYENLPFSITEDSNLLLAIDRLKKYKLVYPVLKESVVMSLPCYDWKTLIRQKRRWGIGGLNSPIKGFIVMSFGFLAHLGMFISPFFFSPLTIGIILAKIFTDFLFLFGTLKRLGLVSTLKYFLAFEIYYTIYVFLLPFFVIPSQQVVWKERKF